MRKRAAGRNQTVLECFEDPTRGQVENPYTALLASALTSAGLHVKFFRWTSALFANYDVLHLHWPENLVRHQHPIRRLAKRALALALLLRVGLTRGRVVRTVHNPRPHEVGGAFETWFLGMLDRMTTDWVVMNAATATPRNGRRHLIPHGHYRDWYQERVATPVEGRLLTFGLIRPYKGTERLLDAVRLISDPSISLLVLGKPSDPEVAHAIATRAALDDRVTTKLRFAPDPELSGAIEEAEIVVLPYASMHNSGAVLLALSLHRPVIVPDSPTTRLLEQEFGSAWIAILPAGWGAEDLLHAIRALRLLGREKDGPEMPDREWLGIGRRYAAAIGRG